MSTKKSITIYDDTVVKLSIKQGSESDRNTATGNSFTKGELAYINNTYRVFVGDGTTVGGNLVGNRYLGSVNSRQTTQSNGVMTNEPKDYNKLLNANWTRTTKHISNYNAYNGDFVYDKYQNALILFDNDITVTAKTVADNSSGTENTGSSIKFINYNDDNNYKCFYNKAVVFRNIIPDNETLEFIPKRFNSAGNVVVTAGEKNPYVNNNVLRIKQEVLDKINANSSGGGNTFDRTNFNVNDKYVTLNETIKVNSIQPKTGNLTLPNSIIFGSKTLNFANISSSGYLYASKSGDTYTLSTKNISGSGSGSGNRQISYLIDEPIYLAWTPTGSANSSIRSETTPMSALLEFSSVGDLFGCTKKIMSSKSLKGWTTSSNPLDSPSSYFSSNFTASDKNFWLWNQALMVRGNNSYASLSSDVRKLANFPYKIKISEKSGTQEISVSELSDLWDEEFANAYSSGEFDSELKNKEYFDNPVQITSTRWKICIYSKL